jgi:hypothetical protein
MALRLCRSAGLFYISGIFPVLKNAVFWDIMPCEPHSVTTQKTAFFIVTAMKTSNLTFLVLISVRGLVKLREIVLLEELHKHKQTPWPSVLKRTITTGRQPLVDEI